MKTTAARYEPSGYFRPTAILLALAATAAGVALAWVYTFAVRLIPWIQLDLIATGGFALLLGLFARLALQRGHCRNVVLALALALPVALVPLAASYWFGYQSTLSKVKADGGDDFTLLQYLKVRREVGWTITNGSHDSHPDTWSGWQVDAVWAVEALIVLGIVGAMAFQAAREPYCERCTEWAQSRVLAIGGRARGDVADLVEQGNIDGLLEVQRSEDQAQAQALSYQASLCPRCTDTAFLTIEEILVVKKGKKLNTKRTKLVKNMVLSPPQRAKLVARLPVAAPTISPVAG